MDCTDPRQDYPESSANKAGHEFHKYGHRFTAWISKYIPVTETRKKYGGGVWGDCQGFWQDIRMHNTTGKNKYQKNGYPSNRMATMTVILLVVAGGALAAISTSSATLDVNNMHCAQRHASFDPVTIASDPPLHDHHAEDLRGNCDGIEPSPIGGSLQRYAVGINASPNTHGELYLRSSFGESREGRVCVTHNVGGWHDTWSCGPVQKTESTSWVHFPQQTGMNLPSASTPTRTWVAVGFSESSWCFGHPDFNCHGETAELWRFSGSSSPVAKIQDPTSGTNPNEYMESDNFTFWRVHDPEGDDSLELGGIPIVMTTGSRLTLDDHGIVIDYEKSDEGGNEWIITSDDGSDTVYVWDNAKGTWVIRQLDY